MQIYFTNGMLYINERWFYHSTQREVKGIIKLITELTRDPYTYLVDMGSLFNKLLSNSRLKPRDKERIAKKLALVEKEINKWRIFN